MTRNRKRQIDLAIASLLGWNVAPEQKRRGRKKGKMSDEEKREVSDRMTRYWATKKASNSNSDSTTVQ